MSLAGLCVIHSRTVRQRFASHDSARGRRNILISAVAGIGWYSDCLLATITLMVCFFYLAMLMLLLPLLGRSFVSHSSFVVHVDNLVELSIPTLSVSASRSPWSFVS